MTLRVELLLSLTYQETCNMVKQHSFSLRTKDQGLLALGEMRNVWPKLSEQFTQVFCTLNSPYQRYITGCSTPGAKLLLEGHLGV